MFVNADWESLATYFDGDALVQDNAAAQDGVSALRAMMQAGANARRGFMVAKIQQVIGQGGFVLITASGQFAGTPAAMYDLFRVKEGKIAEHWDVVQAIPPDDQWKNSNGKF